MLQWVWVLKKKNVENEENEENDMERVDAFEEDTSSEVLVIKVDV